MKIVVKWMDGVSREYEGIERAVVGTDRVLRLYGYEVGGRANLDAEIPIFSVREWLREGVRS